MKKASLTSYVSRLTLILFVLASTLFLSGCGQTGSNGTTPVSISFKIPSADHKVLQAPAPIGISFITLEVSAPDMTPIARQISVVSGQAVAIDLDVPAGSGREFLAKAFNAQSTLLFQGKTTVDLVAGVSTIVKIDMAAITATLTVTKAGTGTGAVTSSPLGIDCGAACSASYNSGTSVTLTATPDAGFTFTGWSGGGCTGTGTCAVTMSAATSVTATFNLQTFKLTILGGGQTGTGPLPGIRVLRHDTTTGAVVGNLLTDANGVADFGDIGATRTTISIVTTRTFTCGQGTCTDKDIFTLVNIPAGTLTDNERFTVNQALSTFSVNLAVPLGTTSAGLITGNTHQENFSSGSIAGSQASFTNVTIDRLQSDLKFSLLAQARNANNAVIGCDFLPDQDPAAVNNTTVSFAATSLPVPIPFTASEPVFELSAAILRKGVTFDQDLVSGGLQVPVTSGTFNFCGVQLAEGFDLWVNTPQTTTASSKGIDMISSVMPTSLNFVLPALSIDSLSKSPDGKTISFTRSGANLFKIDLAFVEHDWKIGNTNYEWDLVGDPSLTSFTLPALPAGLSDRIPPTTGVGFAAFILGFDNINGYDDFLQRYSAAGGEFDDNLIFTATEIIWAGRSNPIISVTKTGTGTGTVTSSPVGINCGASCTAEFTGGTTVILTATPVSPSTFGGWSGECFGTRVSGNTCTLILNSDDTDINVNAQFN